MGKGQTMKCFMQKAALPGQNTLLNSLHNGCTIKQMSELAAMGQRNLLSPCSV